MIYFIAAGKGSRMNSNIPKALHSIFGKPNIVRNINLINDDYRVVVSFGHEKHFINSGIAKNKIIRIESGLGSGHAVMQLSIKDDDIIIWGDAVILDTSIIEEIKSHPGCVVALKSVKNPYVNFVCDKSLKVNEVLFSKYGESSVKGLQDCCIIKMTENSRNQLEQLHNAIWKGRYITESSEFEFHYLMHYKSNVGDPVQGYITEYPDAIESFNNVEELKQIELNACYKD